MAEISSYVAEQNMAIVRYYLEELWNKQNYAIVDEVFAENVTSYLLATPSYGRDEIKQNVQNTLSAFPDALLTVNHLSAEGDKVIIHWTLEGTHQGEYHDISPTGNPVTIKGVTAVYLTNGMVTEIWPQVENLSEFLQQLGGLPDIGA
ncbi:MAG: ester cyclase [Candidatus Promineifilaceae bacterium]|nr:ester cyclase [Candidatus Promineifilaceae bacterium]